MDLYVLFIIIFILLLLIYAYFNDRAKIKNERVETSEPNVIPNVIYQTWHTKDLPPNMQKCVDKLKREHPDYEYHLYDDTDCRNFIKDNFDSSILHAFDTLIPGAYKADLWRYCILYKKGGIYLDIKYQCENGFSFRQLEKNKEYFVLDRPGFWKQKKHGIYNAFMVCKPGNKTLLNCIYKISENVYRRFYDFNQLYPTGPGLLGELYFHKLDPISQLKDFVMNYKYTDKNDLILYNTNIILKNYDEYRKEQNVNQTNKHYHTLWHERNIYK
uniref:Glycosyltransferase n=1 Tax=viral metagenome TaxID=1070528 RepID=A0A6C0HCH7_9ZZZZ